MRRYIAFLLLLLLTVPAPATAAGRLSEVHQGPDWILLLLPSPLPPYKVSALSGPDRLTIEIDGVESGVGTKPIKVDNSMVEQIRFGVYPQKLRVVLDLRVPAKNLKVFEQKEGLWVGPPEGPEPPVVLQPPPKQESPKQEPAPVVEKRPVVEQKQVEPQAQPASEKRELYPVDRREPARGDLSFGAGIFGNLQQEGVGINLVGWRDWLGLEARGSVGTVNQAELRVLGRYAPGRVHQFYGGVGYLYVSKEVDIAGSTREATAATLVFPVGYSYRLPWLQERCSLVAEAAYAPVELSSTLIVGNQKLKTTYAYDQLSASAGLVWYFF